MRDLFKYPTAGSNGYYIDDTYYGDATQGFAKRVTEYAAGNYIGSLEILGADTATKAANISGFIGKYYNYVDDKGSNFLSRYGWAVSNWVEGIWAPMSLVPTVLEFVRPNGTVSDTLVYRVTFPQITGTKWGSSHYHFFADQDEIGQVINGNDGVANTAGFYARNVASTTVDVSSTQGSYTFPRTFTRGNGVSAEWHRQGTGVYWRPHSSNDFETGDKVRLDQGFTEGHDTGTANSTSTDFYLEKIGSQTYEVFTDSGRSTKATLAENYHGTVDTTFTITPGATSRTVDLNSLDLSAASSTVRNQIIAEGQGWMRLTYLNNTGGTIDPDIDSNLPITTSVDFDNTFYFTSSGDQTTPVVNIFDARGSSTNADFQLFTTTTGFLTTATPASNRTPGTYTNVATTGGSGTGLRVNATVRHVIDSFTNISAADASRTAGTYTNVATTGGTGSGLTVDVTVDGSGAVTSLTVNTAGSNYTAAGETITIADSDLGGGGAANVTADTVTVGGAVVISINTAGNGYANNETINIADSLLGNGGAADVAVQVSASGSVDIRIHLINPARNSGGYELIHRNIALDGTTEVRGAVDGSGNPHYYMSDANLVQRGLRDFQYYIDNGSGVQQTVAGARLAQNYYAAGATSSTSFLPSSFSTTQTQAPTVTITVDSVSAGGRLDDFTITHGGIRSRTEALQTDGTKSAIHFIDQASNFIPSTTTLDDEEAADSSNGAHDTDVEWDGTQTYDLSRIWPQHVKPVSAELTVESPTSVTRSQNGTKYARDSGIVRYQIKLNYGLMSYEDYRIFQARFEAARGQTIPFYINLKYSDGTRLLFDTPTNRTYSDSYYTSADQVVPRIGLDPANPTRGCQPLATANLVHLDGIPNNHTWIELGEHMIMGDQGNGNLFIANNTARANIFGEARVRLTQPVGDISFHRAAFNNPTHVVVTLAEDSIQINKSINGFYSFSCTFDADEFK